MANCQRETCAQNADEVRAQTIRHLNDQLRCQQLGGRVCISSGITSLPVSTLPMIAQAVSTFDSFTFDSFTGDNDPYDEHDFGSVTVNGHKVFWKIDYYDASMEFGSPDPADPKVTTRVLTIFLASEY